METKQLILSIDNEYFTKYSYIQTPIEVLPLSTGIGITTFYPQYKNEDVLFKVVPEDEIEPFNFFSTRVIEKHKEPIDKFCAYVVTKAITGLQQWLNQILNLLLFGIVKA